MGVKEREMNPDTRIEAARVILNSLKRRPFIPLMKSKGIKNIATFDEDFKTENKVFDRDAKIREYLGKECV